MKILTEDLGTIFYEIKNIYWNTVKQLLMRQDDPHCFRLHKDKVYYVSEKNMKQATIGQDQLLLLEHVLKNLQKVEIFVYI